MLIFTFQLKKEALWTFTKAFPRFPSHPICSAECVCLILWPLCSTFSKFTKAWRRRVKFMMMKNKIPIFRNSSFSQGLWQLQSAKIQYLCNSLRFLLILYNTWAPWSKSSEIANSIGFRQYVTIMTSYVFSTVWRFRPYKPYIFCEDMILATCQCHSLLSWAQFTVV